MINVLLSPLTFTYERLVSTHKSLYQRNLFKSYKSKSKVISIGNLTMGGTGKTPMTLFLLDYFLKQNLKVAVVSRNYKAEFKGTEKVQLAHPHGASYYGDEAYMLQSRFPNVPIYVGPKKSKTVQMVDENENVDLILVDDGFQHWALKRDIDLVLLDATESQKNYQLVPAGRGRESFSALKRAQMIVITKSNFTTEDNLKWLLQKIPTDQLKSTYLLDAFLGTPEIQFSPSGEVAPSELLNLDAVAFCGLAKPELFFKMLKSENKFRLQGEKVFSDHHVYIQEEVLEMTSGYSGVKHFVTTEKDYKKVLTNWPTHLYLWMCPLIFKFSKQSSNLGTENDFFAKISH